MKEYWFVEKVDYEITLDMAKEISMIQRTLLLKIQMWIQIRFNL